MDRYQALGTAILQDLGVHPDQPITSDLSGQDVAKIMLARSVLKKREDWPTSMIQQQSAAALELFLESNTACEGWRWQPEHSWDDLLAGELKDFLATLLDPQNEPEQCFDLSHITRLMAPGPGAAVGADSTNFYTKLFASPLTATSSYLLSLYRAACADIPAWFAAEKSRTNQYGTSVKRVTPVEAFLAQPVSLPPGPDEESGEDSDEWLELLETEKQWLKTRVLFDQVDIPGSVWFSVPKSQEIQRACATEPNVNVLMQKALGSWIQERLLRVCKIDIRDQQYLNSRLAGVGSVSGLYGTIDLKSASDRNSMAMIEEFCPRMFVKWVKLFRSPYCSLPSGREVKMEMCSSMGNGFTFPLQTALFVGVVYSVYKLLGIPFIRNRVVSPRVETRRLSASFKFDDRKAPGNFGVFGDDIIVRSDAYSLCCRFLVKLGHVVNDLKSFNTGHFRESCGTDYFAGYNVRGVYIRDLRTPLDVYSAINRLTVWSARHEVNLSYTIRLLLGWVKFLPVPFSAADYEGVKVPYDEARPLGFKPPRGGVSTDAGNWQQPLYRGCTVKPSAIKVPWLSREGEGHETTSRLTGNQAGWLVSALGGYCGTPPYRVDESKPDVTIGRRMKPDEPLRWSVKVKVASTWDVTPILPGPVYGTDRGGAWERVAGRHEFLAYFPRV